MKKAVSLLLALSLLIALAVPSFAADYVEIVKPKYKVLAIYNSCATVKQNDQWGCIDIDTGKLIVPITYNWINPFCEGLASVLKNEKWGFIDTNNKTVIPFKYDLADNFYNGLAFVGRDGYCGYVDKNGNEVIPVKCISIRDIPGGLKKAQIDGKWGLYCNTGELLPPEYDWIDSNYDSIKTAVPTNNGRVRKFGDIPNTYSPEDLIKVCLNSKIGYINRKGEVAIPAEYDSLFSAEEGLFVGRKNGKYSIVDKTGIEVMTLDYDEVNSFSEGLAPVKRDGKFGYIDEGGKEVVPPKYDEVNDFTEGLALVKRDGKYGYIDKTGKEVVPLKYDSAYKFSDGLAEVKADGKEIFIDKTGKEVFSSSYDSVGYFSKNFAIVTRGRKYGVIDKTGKEIVPPEYDYVSIFSEEAVAVQKDLLWGFYDKNGVEITPPKYRYMRDLYDGVASVSVDGKYGVVNEKGIEIVPVEYYDNYSFLKSANDTYLRCFTADIKLDRTGIKYTVYDKNGKMIVQPKYDFITDFSEGFAVVGSDGMYGLIDTNFNEVIPLKYHNIDRFIDGYARVGYNEKYGIIDRSGREVVPLIYDLIYVEDMNKGYAAVVKDSKCGLIFIPAVGGFKDVNLKDYFSNAVLWALDNGITTGVSVNKFGSDSTITRSQAVTLLWRAAGCPEPKELTSQFSDVTDPNAWYYKPVLWATEENITNGVGDGSFGINGTLSYDQMLTFMARADGADASGADWSEKAISWAANNGYTEGLSFSAKDGCPRSDVVYCLWKQLAI